MNDPIARWRSGWARKNLAYVAGLYVGGTFFFYPGIFIFFIPLIRLQFSHFSDIFWETQNVFVTKRVSIWLSLLSTGIFFLYYTCNSPALSIHTLAIANNTRWSQCLNALHFLSLSFTFYTDYVIYFLFCGLYVNRPATKW